MIGDGAALLEELSESSDAIAHEGELGAEDVHGRWWRSGRSRTRRDGADMMVSNLRGMCRLTASIDSSIIPAHGD
jgi:hypothetical protein